MKPICDPLEDFNRLEWMTISEALAKLKRGSHKWAVQQYEKTYVEMSQLIE